ncbi:P-loop containing nucleoside triphosphate hydrolase protein [Xylaria sp. FL0043]|nr:P-loop containing nucleoside triphosphate hydrolase protein [Xylaria sp. FL0043]
MWSSRSLASLQKTYDESYLKCSTAAYYESQGDEKEATLCWKNALDQIQIGTASKKHGGDYVPKSETERTIVQSLRELESRCKERIDLLEALRLSRQDLHASDNAPLRRGTGQTAGPGDSSSQPATPGKGWIGDGTIPAITYPELLRPPLPQRPSLASRGSSERAVVGRRSSIDQILDQFEASSSTQAPLLPPYGSVSSAKGVPRPLSPDKRTMRTTLRSGKPDKLPKPTRTTPSKWNKGPGASKAATLAWSTRNSRTNSDNPMDHQNPSPQLSESRRSYDQTGRSSSTHRGYWDSHTRRLVATPTPPALPNTDFSSDTEPVPRISGDDAVNAPSALALGAASSALNALSLQERAIPNSASKRRSLPRKTTGSDYQSGKHSGSGFGSSKSRLRADAHTPKASPVEDRRAEPNDSKNPTNQHASHGQEEESTSSSEDVTTGSRNSRRKGKQKATPVTSDPESRSLDSPREDEGDQSKSQWEKRKKRILKTLPPGVDESAAKAIFNEIVVEGDEVHWSDVAGLEVAKNALREAVVYPFLRPDLFMGLREPATGMLLFGPPGTGKTMLARAVATESKSTFFSISASSLTSKYLGDSEKLVRALFALAKTMAPSIIFVDEIDSLLSQRSGSGDHESTRRIKTEFLIQWSDLQRAAAGRESPGGSKDRGDANRVLVLAATNLPWAIDEAARRRFVRRQYIPLPEPETRAIQLKTLLGQQKHNLTDADIMKLVELTDGFSGSDITALAKDAAMGPLRSLGEALLHMTMDQIRPIELSDFQASLRTIRPSVNKEGLKEYEAWAKQFGERGG